MVVGATVGAKVGATEGADVGTTVLLGRTSSGFGPEKQEASTNWRMSTSNRTFLSTVASSSKPSGEGKEESPSPPGLRLIEHTIALTTTNLLWTPNTITVTVQLVAKTE